MPTTRYNSETTTTSQNIHIKVTIITLSALRSYSITAKRYYSVLCSTATKLAYFAKYYTATCTSTTGAIPMSRTAYHSKPPTPASRQRLDRPSGVTTGHARLPKSAKHQNHLTIVYSMH